MNKLNITYHPDYDIPVPTNHRFVGSKFSDLFDYLQKQSYFSHCEITQPQKANEVRLQRSQSSYYTKKVKEDNLSKEDKYSIFFLDPPFADKEFIQNLKIYKDKKVFNKWRFPIVR